MPPELAVPTLPAMTVPPEIDYEDLDEASEVIETPYSITSYGADYPVDSMVKRIDSGHIFVPIFDKELPNKAEVIGFQRRYVWNRQKADRFIESLLLGLPVPGIFLVKEQNGTLLVLDGHQRLHTLHSFYRGRINGEDYKLSEAVQARFVGKDYEHLDLEDRRRLDDSIVHATVMRQDEPTEDQSSIYTIFERLNTGGVNLQPQEIRVALYHGDFVKLLQRLNDYPAWRSLVGAKSTRLKDLEMILRFFAFFYFEAKYEAPMKVFLNRYMATNRNLQSQSAEELSNVFTSTVDSIESAVGSKAFRPKRTVNVAVVDSVMVGLARRLAKGPVTEIGALTNMYTMLVNDKNYRDAVETGTAQPANVKMRLDMATQAFSKIR